MKDCQIVRDAISMRDQTEVAEQPYRMDKGGPFTELFGYPCCSKELLHSLFPMQLTNHLCAQQMIEQGGREQKEMMKETIPTVADIFKSTVTEVFLQIRRTPLFQILFVPHRLHRIRLCERIRVHQLQRVNPSSDIQHLILCISLNESLFLFDYIYIP